ncbi:MAG: transporter substrate-binding domain-containing protein [Bacteroidota bacterium]
MRNKIIYFLLLIFYTYPAQNVFSQNISGDTEYSYIKDKIVIASEPDYPPYCIVDDNGNADGFSVDLFKAAADAVGIEVDIKTGIWSTIRQDLAEGKVDALPLVGRTPEREELFDFTLPYISLHGAIFVRDGTRDINSLEDLKNKEILVMEGDNAEEFVRRNNISGKIFTTNTFKEAFHKLANGEHDAVIMQRVTGINLLDEMGLRSIEALNLQLPEFRQDFCFAVKKGDYILLNRLNEGLSIVIADGTYEEIRLKWFGPGVKEELTFRDILLIVVSIFVPMFVLMSVFWIIFLRRQVRSQTRVLNNEITERKEREAELRKLKEELEDQVADRTAELQEKVRKLDKSQKDLLNMVEDLNTLTAELKKERRKLELSNKELEAFSYSVSHDLRAPLRAINGFASFLSEDYSDKIDEEGKRYINTIRQNTAKMDQLISDMLNLSRITRAMINPGLVDMSEVAWSIYHETASEEEKKVFNLTIDKMRPAECDLSLIKQVWQNLIDNALKYSSKSEEKRILIGSESDTQEIVYYIKDSGAGFNEKYKDKLFGVFQRLHTENEFQGTGVGLAIVQRIVHRHGGKVWAESKINEGATFYFSLPRINPDLGKNKESLADIKSEDNDLHQ